MACGYDRKRVDCPENTYSLKGLERMPGVAKPSLSQCHLRYDPHNLVEVERASY